MLTSYDLRPYDIDAIIEAQRRLVGFLVWGDGPTMNGHKHNWADPVAVEGITPLHQQVTLACTECQAGCQITSQPLADGRFLVDMKVRPPEGSTLIGLEVINRSQVLFDSLCQVIEEGGVEVIRGVAELLGVPSVDGLTPPPDPDLEPDPDRGNWRTGAVVIALLLIAIVGGIGIYWANHRPAASAAEPGAGFTSPASGQQGGPDAPATQAGTLPSPGTASSAASQNAGPSTSPARTRTSAPAPAPVPPGTPGNVTATADGQDQITVTWTQGSPTVATGFHVDNGCPPGSCGGSDATLAASTGTKTSVSFTVTPGTYQCFRVQAVDSAGNSGWSGFGCTSTPDLMVPGTQMWTDSGVSLGAGERLGLTAAGTAYIDPAYPVGPGGSSNCVPATTDPSGSFPAPDAPCWSLIARIGNGPPFEVGTSTEVTTTAGELYLGMNDDNFADNSGSWTVRIKLGGMPPAA